MRKVLRYNILNNKHYYYFAFKKKPEKLILKIGIKCSHSSVDLTKMQ